MAGVAQGGERGPTHTLQKWETGPLYQAIQSVLHLGLHLAPPKKPECPYRALLCAAPRVPATAVRLAHRPT